MTRKYSICLLAALLVLCSSTAYGADNMEARKKQLSDAIIQKVKWDGPISGPKLLPARSLIFIAADMKNGGILGVLDGLTEAAATAGWRVTILDGAGSAQGQLAALGKATAQKPHAIVIGGWNPAIAKDMLQKASKDGIRIVAWHGTPYPGPIPENNVFFNIATNSKDVATIAALYVANKSRGTAKAVIFTDSNYPIALEKANTMKAVLEKIPGCSVLDFMDVPISEAEKRMPQVTADLLQKYGDAYQYTLAINDIYFDFMAAPLKAAGKKGDGAPFNISAGDGSISAYQRIRKGQYQAATIPEPLLLHGWQIIDECNRALSGKPPSGYSTPVHLVAPENIEFDGGPNNIYDPQNNYREEYKKIWGVR